jgi:hypothetical protein
MRSSLLLVASVLVGAVPVIFGLIRAVSTGDDVRYLWVAAAALIGSVVAMRPGRGTPGPAHVSLGRALSAVAFGAVCAAATALLMGTTAGPALAIVSGAFGLCTGTSAALAALARESRTV